MLRFLPKKETTSMQATYCVLAAIVTGLALAVFRILSLPAAASFHIQAYSVSTACRAFNTVLFIFLILFFALRFFIHFPGQNAHRRYHRDLPAKEGSPDHPPLHVVRPVLPKPFLHRSIRLFNFLLGFMSAVCTVYAFMQATRATNVVYFYYLLAIGCACNAAYFLYITYAGKHCLPCTVYLALIPVIWNALRLLEVFIRTSTYASAGYQTATLLSVCCMTLFFLYEARMYLPERHQWKPEMHFIFACMSIVAVASDVIPRIYSIIILNYTDQQLYFALYDLVLLASLMQRLIVPHTRHNLPHPSENTEKENTQA